MRSHNAATVSAPMLQAVGHVSQSLNASMGKVLQAVAELSKLFTKERTELRRPYLDDPLFVSAYLQYFLPVNLVKIQMLLEEIPKIDPLERLSVLDVGSGPGTGALAVLDWWHRKQAGGELMVTAVDASPTALRYGQQLWQTYSQTGRIKNARLEVTKRNIEHETGFEEIRTKEPFDLVILANSLNEIYAGSRDPISAKARLLSDLLNRLAPHGTLMVVEPALRETSRALHQVRDQLLQDNRCTVYSPCLHENNCPALVNPDDWCHEERIWEPPDSIRTIDVQVGFIKDALKFSYLLLRKDGKRIAERRPDVYRVVSELRELKGEKRAWLCNELGRQEVGRQDRLVSPKNAEFDQWHRGDIAQIERIVRKERGGKVSSLGRIEQDAVVKMIRPVRQTDAKPC